MGLPKNFQNINRKKQNKSLEEYNLYTFTFDYKEGENYEQREGEIPNESSIPARTEEEAQEKFIHNMDILMDDEYIFSYTMNGVTVKQFSEIVKDY